MVILAIDPSIVETGYAVIDEKHKLIDRGVIRTPASLEHTARLAVIYQRIQALVHLHNPGVLAIESQYIDFGKASNAVLKTTEVKGIAVGAYWSIPDREMTYTEIHPKTVKAYMQLPPRTKRAEAKKASIEFISKKYKEEIMNNNITDAILIGLCALNALQKETP